MGTFPVQWNELINWTLFSVNALLISSYGEKHFNLSTTRKVSVRKAVVVLHRLQPISDKLQHGTLRGVLVWWFTMRHMHVTLHEEAVFATGNTFTFWTFLQNVDRDDVIYDVGCVDALVSFIHDHLFVITCVGFAMAVPQMVGVLLARMLVLQVKDAALYISLQERLASGNPRPVVYEETEFFVWHAANHFLLSFWWNDSWSEQSTVEWIYCCSLLVCFR